MDTINGAGESSLHLLATAGCCEGMKLLLDHGADPSPRDFLGRTPLHCCCFGIDHDDRDDLDAAFATCIGLLLAQGADPDARDDAGATPLALAAASGRLGCVRRLVEAGAGLAADDQGDTPLHFAVRARHVDCLEALLQVLTIVRPQEAATMAAVAIYERCRENKRANDQGGESPKSKLVHAAHRLDVDCMRRLLAAGASPDGLLHAVCATPGETGEAVRLLCDFGADLEACDHQENTPLHAASTAGNAASVAALLDSGADASARNESDDTPLHLAAWHAHLDCCRLLVDYGAPVDATNKLGHSPRAQTDRHDAEIRRIVVYRARRADDDDDEPPPAVTPDAHHKPALDDESLLEDEVFFDALIASPSADGAKSPPKQSRREPSVAECHQGFRDPRPLGCANSNNPLYVSSPTAYSPHLPSPANLNALHLSPDVLRDMSHYARAHRPNGQPSPLSAAGAAADDLQRGLDVLRSGRRPGSPPS